MRANQSSEANQEGVNSNSKIKNQIKSENIHRRSHVMNSSIEESKIPDSNR